MTYYDMLEDGFPHGTREGYLAGCRGSHCPMADAGLSCERAYERSHGDYAYQRMVADGLTPAQIIAAEAPPQPEAEPVKTKTRTPARRTPARQKEKPMVDRSRLTKGQQTAMARAWTRANGAAVPDRGPLTQTVIDAWLAGDPTLLTKPKARVKPAGKPKPHVEAQHDDQHDDVPAPQHEEAQPDPHVDPDVAGQVSFNVLEFILRKWAEADDRARRAEAEVQRIETEDNEAKLDALVRSLAEEWHAPVLIPSETEARLRARISVLEQQIHDLQDGGKRGPRWLRHAA